MCSLLENGNIVGKKQTGKIRGISLEKVENRDKQKLFPDDLGERLQMK